jgi:acetyl esterase
MPLSPVIVKFLSECPPLRFGNIPIQEARAKYSENHKAVNAAAPTYGLTILNTEAPTSYGNMPIRLYFPQKYNQCPTLMYFHGGGFVFGDLDSLEISCRELAHVAQCVVISVDYPLAPEHPFPAAPEACYESAIWIAEHLRDWKLNPDRLFISGSSAGATLTAAVTQMILDRGGPSLQGQILLFPMTDADFTTPSYRDYAAGPIITREQCMYFLSTYCPDPSKLQNPLVCPLYAASLAQLPRALVMTAECDPLRDSGRAYAKKLTDAGVECDDLCYEGMVHDFWTLPIDFPEKRDVFNRIKQFVAPQA